LADGDAVPSCTLSVDEASSKRIVTVEGLSDGDALTPIQRAFIDEDAMQCGYCTSGMLISATALLRHTAAPSEPEIRRALGGHLCRCGVYGRVIRAVQRASR
jgi:aerobic-type carbon monoxide dehydrogenase small subunit (CoxS/CutS family)